MTPDAEDWTAHDEEDWLASIERYLAGAVLVHKTYREYREGWDHDHCPFCGAKFMETGAPAYTPDCLTEGWTTTAEHEHGAEYHWVCDTCYGVFRERFRWGTAQDG